MSTELFQIVCPSCGSKLNAKTGLIGQTRNCPKCKTPVLIQRPDAAPVPIVESGATPIIVPVPSITAFAVGPTLGEGVGKIENLPERLQFRNRYLVLGADRLVAAWETGKGWQVNVGSGFASAKKNIAAIPDQGTYMLVELIVGSSEDGTTGAGGPTDFHVFKVSVRGALTSLYRDEGEILSKVDSVGELSKPQKNVLLNYLRQHFMFEALTEARNVIESLTME